MRAEILRTPIRAKNNNQRTVLADFIDDFTPGATGQADQPEGWTLNVDGVSNNKEVGIRIVLTTLKGSIIEQSFTLNFSESNNEAEYEAVLAGL